MIQSAYSRRIIPGPRVGFHGFILVMTYRFIHRTESNIRKNLSHLQKHMGFEHAEDSAKSTNVEQSRFELHERSNPVADALAAVRGSLANLL